MNETTGAQIMMALMEGGCGMHIGTLHGLLDAAFVLPETKGRPLTQEEWATLWTATAEYVRKCQGVR